MRARLIPSTIVLMIALNVQAQGTFQYDQQSAIVPAPANVLLDIQGHEPVGQSFVPSLSSVGFIQFELFDGNPNNGLGATLYVNIRSNSITGPLISSTSPVYMPETPSGGGVTNFFFPTPVAVSPGTTYFFEIVVQSGDIWRVNSAGSYPSGTAYYQGTPFPFVLWFREGVVVPEPSTMALILVFCAGWLCFPRRKR
jgi:hypothetical protein